MKLLLVDTSALFHRSRSALTRAMGEMTTSFGVPVTGTYGFCNALFSVTDKYKYDCIVPCCDKGGNFRKREGSEYKANRNKLSMEHIADMSLLVEDVLPALGFTPVGKEGFEADDIIAHISRNSRAFTEVHILTCDRDLLQLVTPRVKVLLFNSAKKMVLFDQNMVREDYGVEPDEIRFIKSLAGDASDNVKGIPGIGPKTAAKIVNESKAKTFDPLMTLYDRILFHSKVSNHSETFTGNYRLVTLENDIPDLSWFASSNPETEVVTALFEGLEFKSFLKPKRLGKILQALSRSDHEKSSSATANQ